MDRDFDYSCEEGWTLIFDQNGEEHPEILDYMHLPARSMLVFKKK